MCLSPSWIEAGFVALMVLGIQILMFSGYYRGLTSPTGDFLASYNTEVFAWWRDGGILSPPDWMPYTWGGFPAAAQVQNGGWYLPTGLMSGLTPYDIRAASVLQALHVAVAGVGVYVLARRGGFGRLAASFGLVAYSFTTGFYTEAPYPDIVRGFALLPWLLLCLSPLWPWAKWWSTPVAALLLWQTAVGVYPGVLIAIAYSGLAWLAAWQFARRPPFHRFLLPLLGAGGVAVALSMPKYLPQLGLGTIGRGAVEDLTVLNPTTLATLVLPGYPGMPGIFSLNLLFVPAAAVLLASLIWLRRPIVRVAAVTMAWALLLAVPQSPLRSVAAFLPGADASRFRLNDYLPILFLVGVIGAMSGLERLHGFPGIGFRERSPFVRVVILAMPLVLAVRMLVYGEFTSGNWLPTFVVLAATTLFTIAAVLVPRRAGRLIVWRWALSGSLIALACASGVAHAGTVKDLWGADTVAAQRSIWGAMSGELIEHRIEQTGVRRPERIEYPTGAQAGEFGSESYLSGFYTGSSSVGGYFSVHQSASYIGAGMAMSDPVSGADARAFWAAAGVLIPAGATVSGLPATEDVDLCVATNECGGIAVEPIAYSAGHYTYSLDSETTQIVLANEAYYPGWQVLLTDEDGLSHTVEPRLGPAGAVEFDVPAGSWRVSMRYETPLEGPARLAFDLGLLGLTVPLAWKVNVWRRRRSSVPRI